MYEFHNSFEKPLIRPIINGGKTANKTAKPTTIGV